MKLDMQLNQAVVSWSRQQHMMMPADPTAGFIMVKTDFVFSFLEDGFNRPTHAADADKLDQRRVGRCSAEIKSDLKWILEIAANVQPDFRAWQVGTRFNDPQEGEITHQGVLAAFFDGGSAPCILRKQGNQLMDARRMICWVAQTQASWMAAAIFPLRDIHFRTRTPDQSRAFDVGELSLDQFGYAIPKSGRGVTEEIHAGDVKGLAGRGWVEEDSGKTQITSAGKRVRVEVEAETNWLFFAPWSCLNESEFKELARFASQLRDGLKKGV